MPEEDPDHMSFETFGLNPALDRAVADLGFTEPTPIQEKAIPPALAGRDILACAMTGSGKTAAFGLPILQHLIDRSRGTTRALVISPTRELAAQTAEHLSDLAKHTKIRAAAVYGGVGMGPQQDAFESGVDILVATPGRLLDHFQYPYAGLESLEVLVLDEADRMLDMGFLPDIRRVLDHLAKGEPRPRQTMLLSATLPKPIVELAQELLDRPVEIDVERASAPAHGVEQTIYPVPEELKRHLLVEMLRRDEIKNAIVFTRTKHRANRLADFLVKAGVDAHRIHGNRSQKQRTEALADFKAGKTRVLVATDIAARGIDVEALSHVVNFDVPNIPEDYIHRVGRTARASATGDAVTLVSPAEVPLLRQIERAVGRDLPQRRVEGFDYGAAPADKFEVPLQERIAQIRARKAEERARAKAKAERRAAAQSAGGAQPLAAAAAGGQGVPRGNGHGTQGPSGEGRRGRGTRRGRGRQQQRQQAPVGPYTQPIPAALLERDPEAQPTIDPTRERLFGAKAQPDRSGNVAPRRHSRPVDDNIGNRASGPRQGQPGGDRQPEARRERRSQWRRGR
jgi:ATP-dependent RNA helicase RhlE